MCVCLCAALVCCIHVLHTRVQLSCVCVLCICVLHSCVPVLHSCVLACCSRVCVLCISVLHSCAYFAIVHCPSSVLHGLYNGPRLRIIMVYW